MAQREKKDIELRAPESLTLCVNNCGFSGNPATNNMCQSCFQSSAAAAPPPPPSCSPRSAAIRSLDLPTEARKDAEEEDGPKAVKEAAAAAASTPARHVNRCYGCRKRVGLAGFRCRCGGLFCGDHRYSDRHDCSFDYKAAGRMAIARQNPVVRAAKIDRI